MPMNNGGNFVSVPNETVARNYPIAPGNSVTFIDENNPYCYTKTMGLNQLDRPIFKRYRLVEEEDTLSAPQNAPQSAGKEQPSIDILGKTKADIETLRALYSDLKQDVDKLKEREINGKPDLSKPSAKTDDTATGV
jgi:hypothetical protein